MADKKLVKNVTTDDLAVIINKGFEGQTAYMDKKFATKDELQGLSKKMAGIASKEDIKILNRKLDSISEDLKKNNKLEIRVADIENVLNMPVKSK